MTENNSSNFKKCALVIAIASCMSLATSVAEAAGLGKLTVFSSLGQPLKAEVEIAATSEELVGMSARLAPPEMFRQAGVDYAGALMDLRFVVEKRGKGKSVLKLSSVRPVNEPFLDFLVELTWPAGRLVREYTFLLDPPQFSSGQGGRTSVDGKVVETVRTGGPAQEPPVQEAQKPLAVVGGTVSGSKSSGKTQADKSASGAVGETRLVERGDTLRKIASERQYASVSLEQMLVGLYRNNRNAFIENDIHRLKAGAILNIPDEATVASVSQKEARHVYVSAGDFAAYRRKLATAAASAGAREEVATAQSASGRITPKIEDKAPAADAAKDRVTVARADLAAAPDVERIAAEKALQESQSRVASLERNVGELQKLLEMKNQRLAELEKPATTTDAPVVASPPAGNIQPPPDEAPRVVESQAPAATTDAPVATQPPVVVAEDKKAPPPPPVEPEPPVAEETGIVDVLLDNPLPLAGGAAAIALLAGLMLYRRRKPVPSATETTAAPSPASLGPNSVFRMTGGQSVDTGSAPPHTGDFSQAGPGTIDTDEVDPVAEADVYMAYGRDAQAEEILLEAMHKDPNRLAIHAKLLEIYANRRSLKQFETLAGELYAQSAGIGPEWAKVAAMGAEIDPGNPLYGGASLDVKPSQAKAFDPDATLVVKPGGAVLGAAVASALAAEVVAAPAPVAALDLPAVPDNVSEVSLAQDETLVRDAPMPLPTPEEVETGVADDGMSLDFDVGEPVAEVIEQPYVDTVVIAESPTDALDFDLGGMAEVDLARPDEEVFAESLGDLNPAADAEDELEAFGGLDASPDFSPEGTLVISSNSGLLQSGESNFGFDEVPVSEPVPAEEDLSALVSAAASAIQQPVSNEASEADLLMESHELVNTVVNPMAGNAEDMDFDVKLSDSVFLGQPMMASEFDIGSINLDLAAEPAADVRDAQWEEVNTKLDLAKAYEEMGDLEGARELLQEVLGEGSTDLVAEAETILARIGG